MKIFQFSNVNISSLLSILCVEVPIKNTHVLQVIARRHDVAILKQEIVMSQRPGKKRAHVSFEKIVIKTAEVRTNMKQDWTEIDD